MLLLHRLLDIPYIDSENTCSVASYKYQPFHRKVADYLQNAKYPFLYSCRSTPPKPENTYTRANAEHIMKMKPAQHFTNKGYYFQKVRLNNDTKLMVSNCQYAREYPKLILFLILYQIMHFILKPRFILFIKIIIVLICIIFHWRYAVIFTLNNMWRISSITQFKP